MKQTNSLSLSNSAGGGDTWKAAFDAGSPWLSRPVSVCFRLASSHSPWGVLGFDVTACRRLLMILSFSSLNRSIIDLCRIAQTSVPRFECWLLVLLPSATPLHGAACAGDMMVGCGEGEIHRFNLDQGRFRTPIMLPSSSSSKG